ncbi:MAG TPA: hypothetical protein VF665_06635 [Longimicrobium sp.]|jgi:hypothetical protein|uniref:hypothetical protein n=1 Tax=Longimicrobium sp. TaxID=2029185 RepID=UPI002EDB4227
MGASWSAILWSGFVATVLSACVFWLFRSFEWTRFSPTTQLGCLFYRDPNVPVTETVGFLLFFALNVVVVAAVYAGLMRALGGPGWGTGTLLGLVNGGLVVAALPLLERVSKAVKEGRMPPPGRFGLAWGKATPWAILAGHGVYGAVLGGVLKAF